LPWTAALNDRVLGMKADGGKVTVVTNDGSVTELAEGKVASARIVDMKEAAGMAKSMRPETAKAPPVRAPGLILKHVMPVEGGAAVAFWGGMLKIVDADGAVKAQRMLPNDIGAMVLAGGKLVVGLADGQAMALDWR
jgi:hypothetical protein